MKCAFGMVRDMTGIWIQEGRLNSSIYDINFGISFSLLGDVAVIGSGNDVDESVVYIFIRKMKVDGV